MDSFEKLRQREKDLPACLALTVAILLMRFVGLQGEPFSLPLYYAALVGGANLIFCAAVYLVAGALTLSLSKFLVWFLQAVFLTLSFFVFRRLRVKNPFLSPVLLLLSTLFYVFLFPAEPYTLLEPLFPLWQKTVFALLFFLSGLLFTPAVRLIEGKLFRCRLSQEELLPVAALFLLTDMGLYNVNVFVFWGFSVFFLLLYAALFCNSTLMVFALLCSLPPALSSFSPVPIALFTVCAAFILFFLPLGRLPAVLSVLFLHTAVCFFDGLYRKSVAEIVLTLLCVVLPCLLFLFLPASLWKKGEKAVSLYRENHLSRLAVNRNRAAVGERLFTLSTVFRNIAAAISDPPERSGEEQARRAIREEVVRSVCEGCPQKKRCRALDTAESLQKLIAVGCAKGRVSLIDLPVSLTATCANTSGILFCLNKQLGEYRRYALEAENAREGRRLLALQAEGVCELIKNIALEQSKPLENSNEREKALSRALAAKGVILQELFLYGEGENTQLSLTVFGKCENEKIVQAASEALGMPLLTREKLVLAADKYCFILRKKPRYDAVFGVASRKKEGVERSGDTHSVIRIDEKRFLAALSDGMGSGENARRVSENAISLLESFYRSGMPADVILPSVNKLLTFTREESFVCLDLACVDLESGRADLIKIGAPLGFIFTSGSIRVLEGESLPLGMLDDLHPSTLSLRLQDGDVLVFVSDGVTDAFGSSADLFDYLKTLSPLNPQSFAEGMLRTALSRTDGKARDDMTVLAVRIFLAA